MAMSITTPGTNLTGVEDLAQSLALYFTTPKGSIPLHPWLGFAIFNYVDRNIDSVLNMIREVRTGIALWDSRIKVLKATPIFEVGKLKMVVVWTPADDTANIIQSQFPI